MWPRILKLLALAVCLCWWIGVICAETTFPTLHGVLLLRNGEVLQGTATRRADRFIVQLDTGGQLRLPVTDVEFFGHDIDQVYRHLLSRVQPDQADSYLKLSQWCLAQGMLDQAGRCLLQASRIDPYHLEIDRLQQRLLQAARPHKAPPRKRPTTSDQADRPDPPALVELPSGVVSQFARSIQPILLNGCTAAACHRDSSPAVYRLHLPPRGRPMPRRLTLENLQSTLTRVGQGEPDASPLLEKARSPHGHPGRSAKRWIDRRQYQRLSAWARRVAAFRQEADRAISRHRDQDSGSLVPSPPPTAVSRGEVTDPLDPEIFNRRFLGHQGTGTIQDPAVAPASAVETATESGDRVRLPKPESADGDRLARPTPRQPRPGPPARARTGRPDKVGRRERRKAHSHR